MKKLIILLICYEFTYLVNAQTYTQVVIKTPNQTSFYADSLISGDLTSTEKNDAKNFWLNCYNNRIIYKGEATRKYNCHAYAWRVSEGGSKVWINTPNDDNYWEDCSYVEVTNQSDATKVSFGGPCYQTWTTCNGTSYTNPCDHSAITTSSTDYFISKWGPSPLFEHQKDDCPYSTEDLHYYNVLSISGPSLICSSSATFTVNNLPTGTTVSWDESANLTEDPQNPGTFTANGSGAGWVEATLTTGCGEITLPRKTIWAGPKASFTGPTFIAYGGTGTYSAEQSCGYYEWYLQKEGASGGILVQTGNPLTLRSVPRYGKVANIEDPVTRKPPPVGSTVYYLWVNAIAPGVGAASSTHLKITANGDVDLVPEDIMMAGMEESQKSGIEIFPNPTTGETTLTIQTPEVDETVEANTEWELEIYTQSQLLKEKKTNLKGNSTKLQTAGWKEGIYIVRVNFNNKILTSKLVVKK